MVKNKFSSVPVLIVCGLAVVISGCCPTHKYIPVSVPPDKAVVYIYRPSRLVGSATDFSVFAGDKHICDMNNETYFPYISTPGRIKFWTTISPQAPLYVDIMPGKAYYVITTYTYGAPLLKSVESTEAKKEISKCCLVQ